MFLLKLSPHFSAQLVIGCLTITITLRLIYAAFDRHQASMREKP